MNYKRVAFSSIIFIFIIVLLLLYICFVAFSMGFGYYYSKQTLLIAEKQRITVIIDAGHGGKDGGAVGNGLTEKDLNLTIALKLKEQLMSSGYNVIMTRESDILLGTTKSDDLKARLSIAESIDNCIFVSIHMNKFPKSTVRGLQTFYASSIDGSDELAQSIQDSCRELDSNNKRSIKPDDGKIYLLKNTTKRAVLIECGFLSNASDASNLASEQYQNKLVFCICNGIENYLYGS